ncbi:glycoside hydrolase family 13 protein [Macellibacteroides fermentans]|uniref:Glycosidase n=1 Tax=Macellibacteroides fermentans TaxID=879969 RepID=A0A8E1ZY49_9PORP|nr:glycoside hydrolase family 13 protein [Macellibacteroides fermentans]NYI50642.1 glycosidase [Macellibacteroides fermentans]HNP90482.1 glycoside hydrolase family 13 protein [Macellibacteroides fermentans]
MRKNLLLSLIICLLFPGFLSAKGITAEPAFWWSGMKNPELQLMVYGENIASFRPSVSYPGVKLKSSVALESPNYLLVYLDVENAQPGTFDITFTKDKKQIKMPYELKARKKDACKIKGFDSSDVLYLIMPDRFANGDPSNDNLVMKTTYKTDRNDPSARHGGDLAGIEKHLDYIEDLGVTAIWLNPVLENDMQGGSYHGYATTNYYRVDPRFGTNEDYVRLIDKTHAKGMRVVMDMIFNHCGSDHIWMKDVPSKDWFNNLDKYVETSHVKEVYFDPYASEYDTKRMVDGWFVPSMPDLNQRNPHVATYLIQNSIWWIEYSGVDGIRQDTYPYADYKMMVDWCNAIYREYPDYNIVGEAWMNQTMGTAFWQKDSKLNERGNTMLKSVMDFRLMGLSHSAFFGDAGGMQALYEHLAYDYAYADIYNVLRFLDNHDTDRFLPAMPEKLDAFKQGIAFMLTIPGIPQFYYGTELLMNGTKQKGDGYIRLDVPGGWPGDAVNQFEASGRTDIQNEAWNYMQKLLKWRKGNEVIAKGKMKHFVPQNGVYVYARNLNGKQVVVIMNGNAKESVLPLDRYDEILKGYTSGKDVITGKVVSLQKELTLGAKDVLVLEL